VDPTAGFTLAMTPQTVDTFFAPRR
jgi:hypothetical protein